MKNPLMILEPSVITSMNNEMKNFGTVSTADQQEFAAFTTL